MKKNIIRLSILIALIGFLNSSNLAAQHEAQLINIKTKAIELSNKLYDFWFVNGPDNINGGFYGTLDKDGNSINPTEKGIIQQARHLWTFSKWHQDIEQSNEVKLICDNLYDFIVNNFHNSSNNEFYWKVNSDGSLDNSEHRLYSNSFAIYALAQYAISFENDEAANYALNCFNAIDNRTHDATYGGYDQSNEPNWLQPEAAKGTNTQIHLMEAFTTLYEATGNATVKSRLNEMIDHMVNDVIQESDYAHQEFKPDWTIVGTPKISYGHDIETAWLLIDAARAASRLTEQNIIDRAIDLGINAIAEGYDNQNGGLFDSGVPGGSVTNDAKVWWVQAETLLGLYTLYEYTSDATYLDKIEETLEFIESDHLAVNGEWAWYANDMNRNIADEWKASYHNMRSMLFLNKWIELNSSTNDETITHKRQLLIYPNPANQTIKISAVSKNTRITTVEFYTIEGKRIKLPKSITTNDYIIEINAKSLPPGTYLVSVLLNDGKRLSEKVNIIR